MDIEKVFDELKVKCGEQRPWPSSSTAKKANAHFLFLTHNLMLLLEDNLKMEGKMQDTVEPKKKKTRAKTKIKGWREKLAPPFINNFFKRATQRTCRFIGWLRASLLKRLTYRQSLDELVDVWQC